MAKSERFKSDVAMLVSVYRADGKPEMLRKLQELGEGNGVPWWAEAALLDAVYHELEPGDTKEARLARNRLARS